MHITNVFCQLCTVSLQQKGEKAGLNYFCVLQRQRNFL